ncbi:hypothetical protein [Streptomyces sp. NPDC059788]|uniref:hypothetical protein n=1 Tax=Streptomyces sp. NPDC059788 TaxID=3346948 RepID=UPI00365B8B57
MTTQPRPRRAPHPPGHVVALPGGHRTTAVAVLLLAASAAALTWLLLGSRGHGLRTVPAAPPTAARPAGTGGDHTRTALHDRTTAARTGGDCAAKEPRTRGCPDTGRPAPHPPAGCRTPYRAGHPLAVRAAHH